MLIVIIKDLAKPQAVLSEGSEAVYIKKTHTFCYLKFARFVAHYRMYVYSFLVFSVLEPRIKLSVGQLINIESFTFYLYIVSLCAFVVTVLFTPIFVQSTEPTRNFKT